ncbi:MAG TPA: alpha-amylase family glycosyl hydrolase [Acidimicrobiales bacterium]|nr:alpha-amylase family glycosyl hydrolase [Acidimicrobiales bacterium]
MDVPWWQTAVFYQIYPRSFATSRSAPTGDLAGIDEHLDHLDWLGVDAVWLSPFYPSPMADFGYDISDHCDVDPLFGDLAAFDHLLEGCHRRGLRLLVDLVPNHTSDAHPWFRAARSSRGDPKRDWYVWRDGTPDTPPNNWIAAFTNESAWTWDDATGQWYLHLFLPEQPDLNWANPAVIEAMHGVMRFWLDRGVDGFRIDVVHGIGKAAGLPDDPPEVAGMPHASLNDTAETHELIRGMRGVADAYPGDRLLLGEVYLLSTEKVATYYGAGDELHLSFNFPPLYTPWDGTRWRRQIDSTERLIIGRGAWPTWVLSNHDNTRHRTRYGGSEERARAALFLLLGLRGSPVLYHGEELGLEDAAIPPERVVDPGGRDGCRAPIPWTGAPDHGWGVEDPWLPWPPEADVRNMAALRDDPESILHLYRRLLGVRARSKALQLGELTWVDAPDGVVAWRRSTDGESCVVAVNMGAEEATLDLAGTVLVTSDGAGEGGVFTGTLRLDHAVLLDPG